MRAPAPQDVPRTARLRIEGLLVSPDDEGEAWQIVPVDLSPSSMGYQCHQPRPGARAAFDCANTNSTAGINLEIFSGATTSEAAIPIVIGFRPANSPVIDSLPVLVSSELMEQGGLEIGDQLPLPALPGYDGTGTIVGEIFEFPTVEPQSRRTDHRRPTQLSRGELRPGRSHATAGRILDDGCTGKRRCGRRAMAEEPYLSSDVLSREERETTLQSDPSRLGQSAR